MTCLRCQGYIPVPDNPHALAVCIPCGTAYVPTDDYGWFHYSAIIYVPKDSRLSDEHTNHVELLGHYGSDEIHGLAAWCSTTRELTEDRAGRLNTFLASLASEGHHTPFEKSLLHFLVTADTATHIHILKHRIGVSVNGESARYKELKDDKFLLPSDWPEREQLRLLEHMRHSYQLYHEAVERLAPIVGRKRAKESARFYLPYANQIQLDVSFNFRSFYHFQKLRNSPHAQKEVRDVAQQMLALVRGIGTFSKTLEAFGYAESHGV
jgi:flavin-dependent thymidylate synthase